MKNAHIQKTEVSAPNKRHFNLTIPLFPEIEPPVVAALWPNPNTRAGEALAALLEGPLNQADYWQSWRLAASVKELEYFGWVFDKTDIIKPGCRRPIAEYRINHSAPSVIAALELRGVSQ